MEVEVSLDCRVLDGTLHARYIVKNHGSVPLLAYDGAPGEPPGSEWPDMKEDIYISVNGDTVALKRIVPPLPPGRTVTASVIPPLTVTPPGKSREVRFKLAEPLVERSQYTPDFPGAEYRDVLVDRVELHLQCFWQAEGMNLQPSPTVPNAFVLRSAHGPSSIVVARAAAHVRTKQRTDAIFQRI